MKKINAILPFIVCGFSQIVSSQTRVSVATDFSILRSFKKDQRFWAIGQTVAINWHFTPKSGAYATVSYYSNGRFKNTLLASAKSLGTIPQLIYFTNRAKLRLEGISLGWRHYFLGSSDAESPGIIYSITGFGLIFGKASNTYSTTIDTSAYYAPEQPVMGTGHFKRLTLEMGLGLELPLGGDIYFYSEGKVWIPTSDYPSKYLLINNNAPLTAMASAGLRILF